PGNARIHPVEVVELQQLPFRHAEPEMAEVREHHAQPGPPALGARDHQHVALGVHARPLASPALLAPPASPPRQQRAGFHAGWLAFDGLPAPHPWSSMTTVSVRRNIAPSGPVIGRLQCHVLEVFTKTTARLGWYSKVRATDMSEKSAMRL